MKRSFESIKFAVLFIVAFGVCIVSGCATTHHFAITQKDINDGCFSEGPEYKRRICEGVNAWSEGDYRRSGDLLRNAYKSATAKGGRFSTESKIRILGTATKAYHLCGAIEQEKYMTRLLYQEMGEESYILPIDLKVLIYLATLDSGQPAFADEVPSTLRIVNYIN